MRLRRTTIVETRQTTRKEELIRIALEAGISKADFLKAWEDGRAENAFLEDLYLTHSLGISSLPACIIRCGEKAVLVNGMLKYDGFISAIKGLAENNG